MRALNILGLFAAVLVFSSCEKLIKIETPNTQSKIVIESQITTESKLWSVRITSSQAFFDLDSVAGIDDAAVSISDSKGNTVDLVYTKDGFYKATSLKACEPGVTYTLDVLLDGTTYSASELCRKQYPIDTFLAYYIPENNGFIEKGYYVFESAKEWEPDGDYYEWKVFRNDTALDDFGVILDEDRYREESFFNIGIDPADPLAGIDQGRLPRPFPFKYNLGDTARVEQYCINKGYFDFLVQLQSQLNRSGTPFDPPPSNPITNISNGALGYFSVANIVRAETIVKD